ncbi:MAG: hypothetical protein RLZZ422_268 [Pseudomonadota bacterium]|jgi:transcriptional regulator of acetoin/glycerol metabolism
MIGLATNPALKQRRELTAAQWQRFVGQKSLEVSQMKMNITQSWQRSHPIKHGNSYAAPITDPYEAHYLWHQSPIHQAAQHELGRLIDMVSEGELVAAISDPSGRLLWTASSRAMSTLAESANFVVGGRWDEHAAGTNAVGLSLATKESVTVFSTEHIMPCVHDWVCYAAPIINPYTQELAGVLDLSATWDKYTPLGQSAVTELARAIAGRLPRPTPKAELELYLMGQPRAILQGKPIHLSLKQLEILALLALNPRGLSLDAFHAALYGDSSTTTSTLKSELSTLRQLLAGKISSRPYQLTLATWTDCGELWSQLQKNNTERAFELYQGALLPASNSPEIEQWRYCIEAVMTKALNNCKDSSLLLKQCQLSAGEAIRERILELSAR